jgi:hypothetical protein
LIDFFTMQRLRRFARYWDLIANSGNFVEATPLLWGDSGAGVPPVANESAGETPALPGYRSPFWGFMQFSDWLYGRTKQTHGIALARLNELVARYLTEKNGLAESEITPLFNRDRKSSRTGPPRQTKHLAKR